MLGKTLARPLGFVLAFFFVPAMLQDVPGGEDASTVALRELERQAEALSKLGDTYARQGRSAEAQPLLQRALVLGRQARSPRVQAAALYGLARIEAANGQVRQAIDRYREAARLRETIGDDFGRALALHNAAAALWSTGDNLAALKTYQQALQIRERISDRTGIAYTLYGIAVSQWAMGEDQAALDTYRRVLSRWRGLEDARGEANALNSMGLIYSSLGDTTRALRQFGQALAIWEESKDPSGEAYTRNNMGMAYFDQGEFERAAESYRKSLQLLEGLNDPRGKAYVEHNLGRLLLNQGQPQPALQHLERSLELKEGIGDRFGSARTIDLLGEVHLAAGDAEAARRSYENALGIHRQVGDRTGEVDSLGGLARAERSLGSPQAALQNIGAAIELIETSRLKFRSDDLRSSFLASWRDYYGFEIDLLMELHRLRPGEGFAERALEVSERVRSRSLLEALTASEEQVGEAAASRVGKLERLLRHQIEQEVETLDRLGKAGFSRSQRAQLESELDRHLEQYRAARTDLRRKDPHYSSLVAPRPFRLSEHRGALIDDETLLLEFFLGRDRSFLWAVTKDSVQSFDLPAADQIDSRALQLYEYLSARNRPNPSESAGAVRHRVQEADRMAAEMAAELGRILLGTLPSRLQRSRLVLVTDGFLQYVPFGALPQPENWRSPEQREAAESGSGAYLGLRQEVIAVPSLQVLAQLRREKDTRSRAPARLAIFADPVFQREDPRVSTDSTPRAAAPSDDPGSIRSSRLRFSRFEAEEIANLVPASKRLLLLDFSACRESFAAADLSRFQYLHFATHTLVDTENPLLSGIVLTQVDEKGHPQDGVVRLYEIYNTKLQADLVVLSSCRTAIGKRVWGEGLMGLSRGFLYAGASSVMASLWQVEDRATSVFMRTFYEELLTGNKSRQEALQSAQRSLAADPRWQSPYYWAAFVLQGDWL